jgi:hypothetical protein
MKQSNGFQITDKHTAVMVIVISTVLALASVTGALYAYFAIQSQGLLAYGGLLLTGAIAVLCAGTVIHYSVELTKCRIEG